METSKNIAHKLNTVGITTVVFGAHIILNKQDTVNPIILKGVTTP